MESNDSGTVGRSHAGRLRTVSSAEKRTLNGRVTGLWSNSRLQKVTDGINFDGSLIFILEDKIIFQNLH